MQIGFARILAYGSMEAEDIMFQECAVAELLLPPIFGATDEFRLK